MSFSSTSTTTNVGFDAFNILIDGNLVVFRVRESAQGFGGTDLNGDGDTSDSVLHVFDSSTSTTTNVGLAVFGEPLIDGNHVVFRVRESAQGFGGTDLNGDGDTLDSVVHVF